MFHRRLSRVCESAMSLRALSICLEAPIVYDFRMPVSTRLNISSNIWCVSFSMAMTFLAPKCAFEMPKYVFMLSVKLNLERMITRAVNIVIYVVIMSVESRDAKNGFRLMNIIW